MEIFDLDRLHIILQATLLTGLFVARHLRDHDGVDQLLERRDHEGVDDFGQARATQLCDHPGPREAWRVVVNVCSLHEEEAALTVCIFRRGLVHARHALVCVEDCVAN